STVYVTPALFSPRPGSSSEIAGTPPSSRSVTLSPPHRLTLSPANEYKPYKKRKANSETEDRAGANEKTARGQLDREREQARARGKEGETSAPSGGRAKLVLAGNQLGRLFSISFALLIRFVFIAPAEVLPADRSQQTTPVIRRYPARQRKPLYDVEGELILINGSGWSAGIIPPHLMLVSNPTPQPLLPLYRPSPPQTMKRCGRFGQCVNFQTCV
ncbi:hypothetical protein J6590_107837, partial [Homalodisca vitripennis]